MTRHKKHRPKLNSLYQWHRYLGVAVALFAVLLAVTGMMLNHTERLGLGQRQIEQTWLLDWYGISTPEGRYYHVGEQWLSQWDNQLYLNNGKLPFLYDRTLLGAVKLQEMIVAADNESLLLITFDGQLLERLDAMDGIPENLKAIGASDDTRVILMTESGVFSSDLVTGRWQASQGLATWSRAEIPPPELAETLRAQLAGTSLPLERVILDLHSGRLFGSWGSYVMDGAAILLLFNAASGVLIWWRRRRQQRQRARDS